MSLTGIALVANHISTALVCGLSIGNKLICDIEKIKYKKYKKQYEKDQQTNKSFDKLYKISVQYIVIDKNEHESLCIIFTEYVDEKKEAFL